MAKKPTTTRKKTKAGSRKSGSRSSTSARKKAGSSRRGKTAQARSKSSKKAVKKSPRKAVKKTGKKVKKTAQKKAPKKAARKTSVKATQKPSSKKSKRKKVSQKKVARKKVAQKSTKKTTSKKVTKKVSKPKASDVPKLPVAAPEAAPTADAKGGRKGITVVNDKQPARKKRSTTVSAVRRPEGTQLLGPGSPVRKPLIPSGPSAPPPYDPLKPIGDGKKPKNVLTKREIAKFREILVSKRRSLIGDVSQLEQEALRGRSGDLSKTPQHIAEQGSDSAEQTLSLDLAAADRKLIKEIDDALQRIEEGRFGVCELTGRAIRPERLRELPWARYSIDAARELERRSYTGRWTP